MTDHTHHQDEIGPANNELVHHEESDVNIRAIFGYAAGLLVIAVVVHFAIWGLFLYFDRREEGASVRDFPLAAGQTIVPPEPRLQETPRTDMNELQQTQDERLNTYGWIDREAGVVHIPIADAMKLVVERGLLPSRQDAPLPETPK